MSKTNPYIKSGTDTKNYTVPDYTPDNYFAQMDWNKEIENNKQGYLAVDQMTMKEFYDAGGYSFIDDYHYELGQVDAAYDRAQPGYGVKGEQMAKAGLTGSGYSDYLGGQAYAGRVAGQALARQNAMANSNSFRAAYNQYLGQVQEKRAANLQTVVERAQSVNMDPEIFVSVATKLGIPQADAESGKEALIAYYQGLGIIPPNGETANGTTEGSTTGTSGWLTSAQKEEVENVKLQLQGGLTGYTDNDGNVIVPQAPTVKAQLSALYGEKYTEDNPIVQEALREWANAEVISIEETLKRGGAVSKIQLDNLADYGIFGKDGRNSEQYKTTLRKMQRAAGNEITQAIATNDTDQLIRVLKNHNIDTEAVTSETTVLDMQEIFEALHNEGILGDKELEEIIAQKYEISLQEIGYGDKDARQDWAVFIKSIYDEKEKLGESYEKLAKELFAKDKVWVDSTNKLWIDIRGATRVGIGYEEKEPSSDEAKEYIELLNQSPNTVKGRSFVSDGKSFFAKINGSWQEIKITNALKEQIEYFKAGAKVDRSEFFSLKRKNPWEK